MAPVRLLAILLVAGPAALRAQVNFKLAVPLSELELRAKSDSNDPVAHYNVALGYWNNQKWDLVERHLREAVALDPRYAEAHLALAYMIVAREAKLLKTPAVKGQPRPKAYTDVVTEINHEYRHAFLINPMLDLRIIAATAESPDWVLIKHFLGTWFQQYIGGLADCEAGRYADCQKRLTEVIDDSKRDSGGSNSAPTDAYWFRGLAAAHLKQYDAAIADFNILIENDQARIKKAEEAGLVHSTVRTNEYRYFLATFNQAAGNTQAAVDLYHTALENDIGLYIAHVRLAEIFEAARDYPRAVTERQRAIDANPDDPTLKLDLGVTLGKAGRFAEADTAIRNAVDHLPRNVDAWFWLGIAAEQSGNKDEARTAFQKVVALAPSRMQARTAQAKQHLATLQ